MRRLAALTFLLAGCMAPPGPMERLSNSAYDLNTALRFGRKDIALGLVAPKSQQDFMSRHARWGRGLRILDVELNGMRLLSSDSAEVRLMISWQRPDEATIRTSEIAQRWEENRDGWRLVEEIRSGGSPGLFLAVRKGRKRGQRGADGGERQDAEEPLGANTGQL